MNNFKYWLYNVDTTEVRPLSEIREILIEEIGEENFCDLVEIWNDEILAKKTERRRNFSYRKKQNEIPQSYASNKSINESDFIWFKCARNQKLDFPISNQDVVRYMYLATFIDYNNRLINPHPTTVKHRLTPMKYEDLQNILKLSPPETERLIQSLLDNKLLTIKNDEYYISSKHFSKGKLSAYILSKEDNVCIKVFIKVFRELYQKTNSKSHKTLYHLIRLIPYLNRPFNCLSQDAFEDEFDKLKTMSITEYGSLEDMNITQTRKSLDSLKEINIDEGDKSECVIAMANVKHSKDRNKTVFVNPHIFYSGKDKRKIADIVSFNTNTTTE